MPTWRSRPAARTPVVTVPDSAVIDTGTRQVVILDKGEGRFEPREVKLGARGDGFVEIRDGIAEGDRVVASANFLIDAESNLKAALQGLDRAAESPSHDRPPHRLVGAQPACWSSSARRSPSRPGVYALRTLPLDAIPDLSDVQVIVYTDYPGQAPQVVEDQVTYPLTTAMLTVPRSKVVRGFSFFGVSFVYVIFEDGTDPYWARSRVLEYLNAAARRLPAGVTPTLGPDATGVGWVYQYAVVAKEMTLAELRSLQDWIVRFAASPRPRASPRSRASAASSSSTTSSSIRTGCAASGHHRCRSSARRSAPAMDVGGRTVELSEFEFMVRGRGYLQEHRRHREHRPEDGRRHARCGCRTSPGSSSGPTSGAASPSSTARARSRAASSCSASAPTR